MSKRGSLAVALAVAASLPALLAPSFAHGFGFLSTWGKDVIQSGAPGDTGMGFEICMVGADCQSGNGGGLGGEFVAPRAVSSDAAGNIYVADSFTHRIQKFDAQGSFLRTWGKNVISGNAELGFEICTAAASCQAAFSGGAGGELKAPAGVAADTAGNVYVADGDNKRIQKFDAQGNFQRAWGSNVHMAGGTGPEICVVAANCQAGSSGTGRGGEFFDPQGVATDTAGHVYAADFARIQKFDSQGNFERAWGKDAISGNAETGFEICIEAAGCGAALSSAALGGELSATGGIATDAVGSVYVADLGHDRIQKYDSQGNFLRAWGEDVVLSGEHETASDGFEICVNPAGSAPDDVCTIGVTTVPALGGELNSPAGVAIDAAGNVYVGDRDHHRVQQFDSQGNFVRAWGKDVISGNAEMGFEICAAAVSCQAGSNATALGGEFDLPWGLGTGAGGSVLVADLSNLRIQRFGEPPAAAGVVPPPSNGFSLLSTVAEGLVLRLLVEAAGVVEVRDASVAAGASAGAAAKAPLLKTSTAGGGPGQLEVKLKLTRAGKRKLRAAGKAKVRAAITFTPSGGTPNTRTATLKLRKGS